MGLVRMARGDGRQVRLSRGVRLEHVAELAQLKQEMQQRIDQLSRSLEEAQNARIRAEKRAEGNKLSQYLLARLRGQEVSSAGGSEPGSKEQDSADEPSKDAK